MRQEIRDSELSRYVVAHRPRLVRAARLLTAGDDAAAEDLVQTTLTQLCVHWPRVSRAHDQAAYGFRSSTNAFLDEQRRAHRRRELVTHATPEVAESSADPETRRLVMDALEHLAPRRRAVVVLRHFLQYDVTATAEALGCAEDREAAEHQGLRAPA
ncbi:MAG TPA: sigma-70 family RNA polymerase sigma factor [Nocardioides sp.]|nr:sigma-70 family RNA polymerase sigma factor [Nocardioides sp.]